MNVQVVIHLHVAVWKIMRKGDTAKNHSVIRFCTSWYLQARVKHFVYNPSLKTLHIIVFEDLTNSYWSESVTLKNLVISIADIIQLHKIIFRRKNISLFSLLKHYDVMSDFIVFALANTVIPVNFVLTHNPSSVQLHEITLLGIKLYEYVLVPFVLLW